MSAKPVEIFPDIHHKMSKKIAQLTKVIYMLNTKNEDHQAEVDAITANHQSEVQEILRDAASKISKFKENIDSRQSQVNQEAMLDKLRKKHELEKQAAIQEFDKYKSKVSEKETKITKDYQEKFESLRGEIDTMNNRFKEKLVAFENVNKDLRKSMEQMENSSSSNMTEIRRKHEAEVAELVKSSNEKYQNMLLDQLKLQEDLRAEMLKSIENAKKEAKDTAKAENEKLLGQLRAQLSGDKQESIMAMRREWEDKLQSQKDDYMTKLERAISDIKVKEEENKNLKKEHELFTTKSKQQFQDAQQSLLSQKNSYELQLKSLEDTLSLFKEEILKLKTQNIETSEELTRAESQISEKNNRIHELELQLVNSNAEITKLTSELDIARQSGAASESDLRTRLLNTEKEITQLRAELAQSKNALTSARDEISSLQVAAQKASTQAEKNAIAATREKEKLQQQLQDALNGIKNTSDRSSEEITQLRKQMAEREATLAKELTERSQLSRKDSDALQDKLKIEIEARLLDKKTFEESLQRRERELLEDMERQKKGFNDRISALEVEHRKVEDELTSKYKEESDKLKQNLQQLTNQLQDLSDQADGDKSTLRTEMTKLESKTKALQIDLDTKIRENARSETVCTSLKTQVENLRDELKASQKAFRDKMEASQAQSDSEWYAKIELLKSTHDTELSNQVTNHQKALKTQYDELNERHEAELVALRSALQKEANQYNETLAQAERDRIRLENDLRIEKSTHLQDTNDLIKKHNEETRDAEERRRRELEALRKELTGLMGKKDQENSAAQNAVIEALRQSSEKKLNELQSKAAADRESALVAAAKTQREALEALERRLTEEKNKALTTMEASNTRMVTEIKSEQERQIGRLNQDMDGLKQALISSQKQVNDGEQLLATERKERARREEQFLLSKDQLLRDHEGDLRREKERSDGALREFSDRITAETRSLKQEFKEEKNLLEEKIRNVQNELSVYERRFRDRESRPEDLQRIRVLEEEMVEKDALVLKTKEEMLYFKREMLNREDNYNLKFNSKPNVGVMQVLKSKDTTDSSSNNNTKKQTRTLPGGGSSQSFQGPPERSSSNPGGPGMGMGLGLGIGIAGGVTPGARTKSLRASSFLGGPRGRLPPDRALSGTVERLARGSVLCFIVAFLKLLSCLFGAISLLVLLGAATCFFTFVSLLQSVFHIPLVLSPLYSPLWGKVYLVNSSCGINEIFRTLLVISVPSSVGWLIHNSVAAGLQRL
eukprot:gene4098-8148_t